MRQLGCADCAGAEQFSRIQGLAVDEGGGIYVANLYPPFLRVWSSEGELVAFVGEEGSGPGEYRFISEVFSFPDGGFSTVDIRHRRWTLHGPAGEVVPAFAWW